MEKKISDEQLMAEVKQGDLDKMAVLFERYQHKMYNFFLHISSGESALSQDLTQNLFYRLLRYRESFDSQQNFRTWLYQIARNVFYSHFEKNKRYITDSQRVEQEKQLEHDASFAIEQEEENQALLKSLDQLSADHKQVLVMNRFQGLKYKEIAQIFGISEGAVKIKAHRAIGKLRKIYFQHI